MVRRVFFLYLFISCSETETEKLEPVPRGLPGERHAGIVGIGFCFVVLQFPLSGVLPVLGFV